MYLITFLAYFRLEKKLTKTEVNLKKTIDQLEKQIIELKVKINNLTKYYSNYNFVLSFSQIWLKRMQRSKSLWSIKKATMRLTNVSFSFDLF